MSESNLQLRINAARHHYTGLGQQPLLERICKVHGITQREFAAIFGISKAHAEAVIKHRTMPSLELGLQIARYWECTVEELFGWRVDDDKGRRPLIIKDPETGEVRRLNTRAGVSKALDLIGGGKCDTQ